MKPLSECVLRSFAVASALLVGAPHGYAAQSILALGFNLHSGSDMDSIAGSNSFSGMVGAESSSGAFRVGVGLEGHYGTAILNYNDDLSSTERLGAELRFGARIHFFESALLQPMLAASGILALDLFRASDPPTGISSSEAATGLGYEVEAGIGIPWGASQLRLLGAYGILSTKLGSRTIVLDRISMRLALSY